MWPSDRLKAPRAAHSQPGIASPKAKITPTSIRVPPGNYGPVPVIIKAELAIAHDGSRRPRCPAATALANAWLAFYVGWAKGVGDSFAGSSSRMSAGAPTISGSGRPTTAGSLRS